MFTISAIVATVFQSWVSCTTTLLPAIGLTVQERLARVRGYDGPPLPAPGMPSVRLRALEERFPWW